MPTSIRPLLVVSPRLPGLVMAVALLGGCIVTQPLVVAQHQDFDSTTTHSRAFAGSAPQTCEAARRALLSQGYIVATASADLVAGKKNFQPNNDMHIEIDFRVVCAREGQGAVSTIAFATALQDRYALKKVNNSASLGVGAIGSVSLPFSSSDDAMVKVASQTLTDTALYNNFFRLVQRYLEDAIQTSEPVPPPPAVPGSSP